MKELEYALEAADEGTFEGLAAAFVRSRGYRTREFRAHTGEWSARIWMRSRPGIACASVATDWREALRSSARKVKRIERERGEEYGLFVFVTNQDVTGLQEFDMEDEIAREYGWRLRLYHRQDLVGELYNTAPGLAKHHLDINLGFGFDTDHLATLEELRDERVATIGTRSGEATELASGPAVAVHVVPNGIFSTERRWASSEIPDPSVLAASDSPAVDARETLKIAYDRSDGTDYAGYALIRNDGLYESATTRLFYTDGGELLLRSTHDDTPGLDASVTIAVRETLADLSSMGFAATASIWISVLDAARARLDSTGVEDALAPASPFGFERYSTRVTTASIADREHAEVLVDLEPALSELWRAFGYPDGTPNVANGEWSGEPVPLDGSTFP